MKTRPQRIALSRVINIVIKKTQSPDVQSDSSVESAVPEKSVETAAESPENAESKPLEEVNPWIGKTIRIGCGRYLNQIPLNDKLEEVAAESGLAIEINKDIPRHVGEQLFDGDLDVAMVSLVDFFQRPEFFISSDACVASEGLVRSVLLYGKCQPNQIKTIAMDEGSKTSAVMTRILLAEQYGIHPEISILGMNEKWEDSPADAVMLIGDRALRQPQRGDNFSFVWDMGLRWTQWTGVPFVYSVWLSQDKYLGRLIGPVLSQARDRGMEAMSEIIQRESKRLGISPAFCEDYLTNKLTFRLAGRQRKGIEIFCRLAKKHGLIDIGAPIPFNNHYRYRLRKEMEAAAAAQAANSAQENDFDNAQSADSDSSFGFDVQTDE